MLTTQPVDVPLAAGLHQEVADQVLPVGALILNENTEVSQMGRLRKRPGCVAMSNTTPGGSALDEPLWMGTYEAHSELLRVRREPSVGPQGTRLLVYADQREAWVERAALPSCTWTRSSLVRRQTDLGRARAAVAIDPVNRYRAVAWLEIGATSGRELRFRVDHLDTGSVIVRERQVPSSAALTDVDNAFALLFIEGRFIVVWTQQTPGSPSTFKFKAWRYRTDTLIADGSAIDIYSAAAAIFTWDVTPLQGGAMLLVWIDDAVDSPIRRVTFQPYTWAYTVLTPYVLSGRGASRVRCHSDTGVGHHAIAWINSDGFPAVALFSQQTNATLWDVPAADTTQCQTIEVHARSDDSVLLVYEIDQFRLRTREYQPDGTPVAAAPRELPALILRSRPFQPWSDNRIAALVATVTDDVDPRNGGYHLVDLTTYSLTGLPAQWHGSMATIGATPQTDLPGCRVPRVAVDQAGDTWHVPVMVRSESNGVRQVDLISGTAERQQLALWQTAEANGLLYLTGGMTAVYDGQSVVEAGFVQSPAVVVVSGNAKPGTAGLAGAPGSSVPGVPNGNVYLYQAIDAWRDSAGNTHYGPPSAIATVRCITDSSTGNNAFTPTVQIQGPVITRKAVSPDSGSNPEARPFVLIYRTKANSSGPFYLLNDPTSLPYPANMYSQGYVDSASDASLGDDADPRNVDHPVRPHPYTHGGILENRPPPPSTAVCVHGNRVWLADAEDPKRLWFSKAITPGSAPGFNLAFTLRLDDSSDGITALASLDQALVVFTKSRIYLVEGPGPNDQGQGQFPSVRLLTTSAGAVTSRGVVRCERGVFFQDASGLMLLAAQGALPEPAGLPVQELLRGRAIVRAVHDAARRRIVWLLTNVDGATPCAVYDYRHDLWGAWYANPDDGNLLRDQTLWRGRLVWATTNGAFVESSAVQTDAGFWIYMRVRTAPVRPGALAGWQRTRRLIVRGKRVSNCSLSVGVYLNQSNTAVEGTSWNLDTGGDFSLGHHVANQKAQAVSFEFVDAPLNGAVPTSGPTGVELYGLTIEVGIHQGLAKLAATQRK